MSEPKDQRTLLAEINVTPFVDVMLVLLVIFMVTAPFMTKGVKVDLPEAKAEVIETEKGKLVLVVDKNKKIFLEGYEIPYNKLEERLIHNERLKREGELFLQADENIPYGFIVKIMAIARQAGVRSLGMITDSLESDER